MKITAKQLGALQKHKDKLGKIAGEYDTQIRNDHNSGIGHWMNIEKDIDWELGSIENILQDIREATASQAAGNEVISYFKECK